jgi:hypothetical protein
VTVPGWEKKIVRGDPGNVIEVGAEANLRVVSLS